MKPVIYEPHPVTPERKRELLDQGYRIIDARFAPADHVVEVVQEEKPKRQRNKAGK